MKLRADTNQEILTKAVQKAIDGGWKHWAFSNALPGKELDVMLDHGTGLGEYDIIFNHDFAKALWGEEVEHRRTMQVAQYKVGEDFSRTTDTYLKAFEYHLQQMVIAEDPIKYLGENAKIQDIIIRERLQYGRRS